MSRRFEILDRDDNVLGEFEAPDDATDEEIDAYHAQFRAQLLARRAEEEEAKKRPNTSTIVCGMCGNAYPRDDFKDHVRKEAIANGVVIE